VVVDAIVMLVVLESDAVPVVVDVLVVGGRHSEHRLHVAHWQSVVQGSDCCRQDARHNEDPPASVVVVICVLRTGVVVIIVDEVNSVLVAVGNVSNDVLKTGVVVVPIGMMSGDGCDGSTTLLQSEHAAQVGQLHLMYQGWPFPIQYGRHSLGCRTGVEVDRATVVVAVVAVIVTGVIVAVVVVVVHITAGMSVRSEDICGTEQTLALQTLAVINKTPKMHLNSRTHKGGTPRHSDIHVRSVHPQ